MLYLDYSSDYQFLFQDSASPMMNGIMDLHHYVMFFLFIIVTFVLTMLFAVIQLFIYKQPVNKLIAQAHFTYDEELSLTFRRPARVRKAILKYYGDLRASKNNDIVLYRNLATICTFNALANELYAKYGDLWAIFVNLKLTDKTKSLVLINQLSTGTSVLNNVSSANLATISKFSVQENFSSYLLALYSRNFKYKKSLPAVLTDRATFKLRNVALESLAIVNVFPAYSLNLLYWMQTYFTLRSGINNFTHSTVIEIVWTIIPSLVLVFIGVPSFILLYAMDEIIEPDLVIKCIGHQWYWSYETVLESYDVFTVKELQSYHNDRVIGSTKNVLIALFNLMLDRDIYTAGGAYENNPDRVQIEIIAVNELGNWEKKMDIFEQNLSKFLSDNGNTFVNFYENYVYKNSNDIAHIQLIGAKKALMSPGVVYGDEWVDSDAFAYNEYKNWNNIFSEYNSTSLLHEYLVDNPSIQKIGLYHTIYYKWATFMHMDQIVLYANGDTTVEKVKNSLLPNANYNFYNVPRYINFDSYMIDDKDLVVGTPRLLEVDNPLVLPVKTHIDVLVTANDVIHCWTVPSFGIKMDAVPGRLNHANVFIERTGVFYGQCSEICGVNHGFMPIKIIAVNFEEYNDYLAKAIGLGLYDQWNERVIPSGHFYDIYTNEEPLVELYRN